jgi:hypothetical protein
MGLVTPGILIRHSSRSVRGVRQVRTNHILEGRAIYGLSQIPSASCLLAAPDILSRQIHRAITKRIFVVPSGLSQHLSYSSARLEENGRGKVRQQHVNQHLRYDRV